MSVNTGMAQSESGSVFSAWNPGVLSGMPDRFRSLETIQRSENVEGDVSEILALAEWSALSLTEIAAFRASRLALHELVVRVTAGYVIPEGASEEDFGLNFRRLAGAIWREAIQPRLPELESLLADTRAQARDLMAAALADAGITQDMRSGAMTERRRFRFFGRAAPRPAAAVPADDFAKVASLKRSGLTAQSRIERAVYRSLYRLFSALFTRYGRINGTTEQFVAVAVNHLANTYGSQIIGERIEPEIDAAARRLGLQPAAVRRAPIIISLKGPSAAGKSSLRPQLKRLLDEDGVALDEYATISPDVWRRMLLDFDSLGEACKYAGHLTSREVAVIDAKLDAYITERAERAGGIPNILVDRFRFDSFAESQVRRVLSGTYARYVSIMYMYFIVTPPHETVTRGWERGLRRGRYKSVDDFLAHCVEAYSGMPKLFFRWLNNARPEFRYTFLDNDVPKNAFPRTIATGNQSSIRIMDLMGFVNIERYQKINVFARSEAQLFAGDADGSVRGNCGFLRECIHRIRNVALVDPATGRPFAEIENGRVVSVDPDLAQTMLEDDRIRQILEEVLPAFFVPGPQIQSQT